MCESRSALCNVTNSRFWVVIPTILSLVAHLPTYLCVCVRVNTCMLHISIRTLKFPWSSLLILWQRTSWNMFLYTSLIFALCEESLCASTVIMPLPSHPTPKKKTERKKHIHHVSINQSLREKIKRYMKLLIYALRKMKKIVDMEALMASFIFEKRRD